MNNGKATLSLVWELWLRAIGAMELHRGSSHFQSDLTAPQQGWNWHSRWPMAKCVKERAKNSSYSVRKMCKKQPFKQQGERRMRAGGAPQERTVSRWVFPDCSPWGGTLTESREKVERKESLWADNSHPALWRQEKESGRKEGRKLISDCGFEEKRCFNFYLHFSPPESILSGNKLN